MDPQQAWNDLLDLMQAERFEEAADVAEDLIIWLNRFGVAPQISPLHRLHEPWCRVIARAACEGVLELADRECP